MNYNDREKPLTENGDVRFEHGSVTPEQLTAWVATGFDGRIGLRYTELTPDRVRAEFEVTPDLHQPAGLLHGGVHCAVIESIASCAAGLWWGSRGSVVGVNNNTDFLRAAREGMLYGEASPIHRGKTQQIWVVTISDAEQRLVARGQVRLQNIQGSKELGR
ncbi:PaaI family thioesterase [Antrihabitans sp. YC2-6]|uniref:PaaI family thioesterase n=1 Tax=Antrihabitans sp. YC2-6 TaxID=2799498 RepID=UPI0018F780FD|nr:PaaI family thioesterase [Antrihabitans sp. YC2-6]MBJ8348486.1 PaaI family thioesterase [Antrihabitans sp. YC2-6]